MVRKGKDTEWAVKQAIKKVLDSYSGSYRFMPVPYGLGASTVDFIVCHYGLFIGIEAKAPGEVPTARQELIIKQIQDAGGEAFVIDSIDKCHHLRVFLEQVKQNATSPSQPQTPDGGSAARGKYPKPVSRREALDTWRRPAHPPAASADGNVLTTSSRIRRPQSDIDALRLEGRLPLRKPKKYIRDVDAGAESVRPERDGDRED